MSTVDVGGSWEHEWTRGRVTSTVYVGGSLEQEWTRDRQVSTKDNCCREESTRKIEDMTVFPRLGEDLLLQLK